MSASLVGSEMCIRDRWNWQGWVPFCRRIPERANTGEASEELSRVPRPVSYTHLTLPTICSV
eukprot:6300260-Alexandrium_andersonii.AAC.1